MTASGLADSSEPDQTDGLRFTKTAPGGDLSQPPGSARSARSLPAVALWGLASVPAVALTLLVSMAVRVRISDGAWPVRNQPDPKELGLHNTATVVMILLSFAAVVVVPILTIVLARSRTRRLPVGPLLLGLLGFIVLVAVLRADVAGLGDWIGD